jgi:hypothetical protein
MSLTLRVVLILVSLLAFIYIVGKIRNSKMQIEYTLFWIILSIMMMVMAIFPQILYWLTGKLGFMSTSNLVYLIIIGILLLKVFMMTIEVSALEQKVQNLVQELALNEKQHKEDKAEVIEQGKKKSVYISKKGK